MTTLFFPGGKKYIIYFILVLHQGLIKFFSKEFEIKFIGAMLDIIRIIRVELLLDLLELFLLKSNSLDLYVHLKCTTNYIGKTQF